MFTHTPLFIPIHTYVHLNMQTCSHVCKHTYKYVYSQTCLIIYQIVTNILSIISHTYTCVYNSHHEYEQDEGKIISFPAREKKNEASSGDLPSVAGRYYLVPREILLPLPGTRTLLRGEACIPVSEQAGGHSKQVIRRALLDL